MAPLIPQYYYRLTHSNNSKWTIVFPQNITNQEWQLLAPRKPLFLGFTVDNEVRINNLQRSTITMTASDITFHLVSNWTHIYDDQWIIGAQLRTTSHEHPLWVSGNASTWQFELETILFARQHASTCTPEKVFDFTDSLSSLERRKYPEETQQCDTYWKHSRICR